ncbi:MAG: TIM barrel protein [Candidatus Pacearchaeota archaeon]
MIFVGPAGNASMAREPGTEGSLKWLAENGLNAQEIEFVRSIYLKPERAEAIGKLAKQLGIRLSVHAPYFINLASESKAVVEASKRMLFDSADRAERLGADAIAVHIAYYAKQREKTAEIVKAELLEVLERIKKAGIKNVKLGIETMAKPNQFPTLDECIAFCQDIKHKQVVPYIDWAHIFCYKASIDYAEIFEKLKPLKLEHINSHFSNMKYDAKKKGYVDIHQMIDKCPDFVPLAQEILKRKCSITIIAESKPWPDKDALKIKDIFAKLGMKLGGY